MKEFNEKTKENYSAFGLNIASDFVLDAFLPGEEAAEIEIINGKVPEDILDPLEKNVFFQTSKREFLFDVKGVAKFLVSDGKRMIIEPYEEADDSKLKSYLYGTTFEILLLQRGMLAIHGSSVVVDGKCIIISGASGAGKSTLALALRQIGYPFLTDDVSFLSLSDDGTIWVCPGFPVHKLCRDSAEAVGIDIHSISHTYLRNENKYFLPVRYGYQEAPARLFVLWELKADACNEVSITRLDGMQKLSVLLNHSFHGKFLSLFKREVENFKKLSSVAESIQIYQMIRPQNIFTLEKQIKLILKEIEEL